MSADDLRSNLALTKRERGEWEANAQEAQKQVDAVLELHRKETRWIHESNPEVSWNSREQALDYDDDMDPALLTTFDLCEECKRVEEGPDDGEHILDVGYSTSAWPCLTITTLERASS